MVFSPLKKPLFNKAIFLDRDGVISIPEFRDGRSYAPRTLEQLAYFNGVPEALARYKHQGYLLIVVTNQPDVGNGIVDQTVIENMHHQMLKDLPLDAIQVCYHAQTANCACRKPKPGLFYPVIERFNIDVTQSFMIGDRSSDIAAGKVIGCQTVFIDYSYLEPLTVLPDHCITSLLEFDPLFL